MIRVRVVGAWELWMVPVTGSDPSCGLTPPPAFSTLILWASRSWPATALPKSW